MSPNHLVTLQSVAQVKREAASEPPCSLPIDSRLVIVQYVYMLDVGIQFLSPQNTVWILIQNPHRGAIVGRCLFQQRNQLSGLVRNVESVLRFRRISL